MFVRCVPVSVFPSGALALLLASACTSHRAEAEVVVHHVEAVIKADGAGKAIPLARLTEAPCVDPEVCRVKRICEEAFGPLVASYRLAEEVRGEVAKGGDVDKVVLAKKLDEAEAAKEKARGLEEKCLIAKAELARKHRL